MSTPRRGIPWRSIALRLLALPLCAGLYSTVPAYADIAAGMTIQAISNDPTNVSLLGHYDRFDTTDRTATGSTFVASQNNWSGVGMGFMSNSGSTNSLSGSWATMISPSYFISANHYNPSNFDTTPGDTTKLRFYYTNDTSGGYDQYSNNPSDPNNFSVVGEIGNSDLWLGKLSTPVSTNVAKYPILALPASSSFYSSNPVIYTFGATFGDYGAGQRLGRNQIDSIHPDLGYLGAPQMTGYNYRWDYNSPGVGPDESMVQGGDSGAPNFVNLSQNLMPAVVGVNWIQIQNVSGQGIGSGSTFVPAYVASGQPTHFALDNLEDAMYGSGEQPSLVYTTPLLGDFNLDGKVTVADVQSMLLAMSNMPAYEALHGVSAGYATVMGDFDHDGQLTNADLQGLITLLANGGGSGGGSVSVVPEPASLLLLACGIWPIWWLARRNTRLCSANLPI